MDSAEKKRLAEQSKAIRKDLKSWEKTFAASNNGKKASRDDIKQHPEIGTHGGVELSGIITNGLYSCEILGVQ